MDEWMDNENNYCVCCGEEAEWLDEQGRCVNCAEAARLEGGPTMHNEGWD